VQAIALTKTAWPLPSSQARVAVWSGLIVSVHSWKASAATRAWHAAQRRRHQSMGLRGRRGETVSGARPTPTLTEYGAFWVNVRSCGQR
jgi:hypothetical protein